MKLNVHQKVHTHEGAQSTKLKPYDALKRSVLACMLWEDNFYENGQSITDRIASLCLQVPKDKILLLAEEAHEKGNLRHIPLFLLIQAFKKNQKPTEACASSACLITDKICSRPDQMTELLSLYWKDGKKPLPAQMKKGLAKAFTKFDEYQLAKYNRDTPIKLRDVLFLCHAKPKDEEQAALWKRLISNTLKTPDTWEVRLSAGENKKKSFEELLKEGKMGKLAILRNLRNMFQENIDKQLVKEQLLKKSRPMLPFQFISASKACPAWEDIIDESMIQALEEKKKIPGVTATLIDVSGSMSGIISRKSDVSFQDAAAAIAILLREVCENYAMFTFSEKLVAVPPRRGMALRDAIATSQPNSGTYLGGALQVFETNRTSHKIDRIIVITDEQTHDEPPKMNIEKCYIVNVSSCQNGIKNNGQWVTISGFSEAVIDYIQEIESLKD